MNVVCPFKCCHQASNLEYLKKCVTERSEVPRLVQARENRAALQASFTASSEVSPAGTESTLEFASPDSPPQAPLSQEQVKQVKDKCTYLRSLARGLMGIQDMSVSPASAAGTELEEEETPTRTIVLPVVEDGETEAEGRASTLAKYNLMI